MPKFQSKKFLNDFGVPFVAVSSMISGVFGFYLATRVIKTSHWGYMTASAAIGVLGYSPIIKYRGKWEEVKSANVSDMLKFILLAESPSIIAEFFALKMYEKQVALPNAILSCYPILILLAEKLTPKMLYKKTSDHKISIDHGLSLNANDMLKYALPMVCYAGSVSFMYVHQSQKYQTGNSGAVESAIFASGAAILIAMTGYFTGECGRSSDPEVLTYLTLAYSIPIRGIFCAMEYSISESASFKHDFINNIADMPMMCLLSAMYYYHYWGSIYAFSKTEDVSSCALLTTISSSTFSVLLEEKFNILNVSIYAYLGLITGILGSRGMTLSNQETHDSDFLMVILDVILYPDCDKATHSITVEWDSNRNMYDPISRKINLDITNLDTKHYNELLLALLTKTLNLRFSIQDQNGKVILIFINQVAPDDTVQEINIIANISCVSDQLHGYSVTVANDHIELLGEGGEVTL